MKTHTINLNEREIEFRLTSEDCVKLEEKEKVRLLDYIQDYSMKAITTLLFYLRKGVDKGFSRDDAYKLFDELVDSEWALEDMMKKIIFPACQVSGLLTKADLEETLEKMENRREQATEVNQ